MNTGPGPESKPTHLYKIILKNEINRKVVTNIYIYIKILPKIITIPNQVKGFFHHQVSFYDRFMIFL